jgi:hypothetical protein
MTPISRGFRGRSRPDAPADRVPPGQYVTDDFPVLSAGPTPHTPLDQWTFSIEGEIDEPRSWTWDELRAPPSGGHEGHPLRHEVVEAGHGLGGVSVTRSLTAWTEAEFVLAFCDGGYTTNLPLEDVTGGKAWVAFGYESSRSTRARRSGAAAGTTPLLLEEREVGARVDAPQRRLTRLLSSTATTTTAIRGGAAYWGD